MRGGGGREMKHVVILRRGQIDTKRHRCDKEVPPSNKDSLISSYRTFRLVTCPLLQGKPPPFTTPSRALFLTPLHITCHNLSLSIFKYLFLRSNYGLNPFKQVRLLYIIMNASIWLTNFSNTIHMSYFNKIF